MDTNLYFYYPSIEGGGLEKNLFSLINSLAKRNCKVNFITYEDNTRKKEFDKIFYFHKKINVIISRILIGFKHRYIKYIFCFIKLFVICVRKKGVIISFQGNILPIIVAKLTGTKIIIRCNTAPSKYVNNLYEKIFFNFFYSMSDQILVTSKDFKNEIKKYFNLKSFVHKQTLDMKEIKKKAKVKIKFNFFQKFKGLKIINVGRLTFQKDQITLLRAFARLIKTREARLLLMGTGEDSAKLNEFIRKEKLTKNVKIIGFNSNPFKYISLSDVKVLSSRFEGNPNILLEIACLKKLIISTNCKVGPNEILQSGKGGILFPVGNYNYLYLLLKKLNINTKINKKKIMLTYKSMQKNYKKDISETFIENLKKI
jgi:glycosyltransferase involved in cell wall biosynthesis